VRLHGADPVLPSSFAVGTAAQAATADGALAATEVGRLRNGLAQEGCTHFLIDGQPLAL
jgi:hypothetical protein